KGMLPTLPEGVPEPLNELELAEVVWVAPERWKPAPSYSPTPACAGASCAPFASGVHARPRPGRDPARRWRVVPASRHSVQRRLLRPPASRRPHALGGRSRLRIFLPNRSASIGTSARTTTPIPPPSRNAT